MALTRRVERVKWNLTLEHSASSRLDIPLPMTKHHGRATRSGRSAAVYRDKRLRRRLGARWNVAIPISIRTHGGKEGRLHGKCRLDLSLKTAVEAKRD